MNRCCLGAKVFMTIEIFRKKWSKPEPGTEYSLTRRSREQPIIYIKMLLIYSIDQFTDILVNLCTKSGEKIVTRGLKPGHPGTYPTL